MANTISDKLDLLLLSKEERQKAQEKFLATLSLLEIEELIEISSFLKKNGVEITKAREIKVFANTKEEIVKKFNILSEIHETGIYKNNPNIINNNVIDIYKRIQYCKQIGKNYKTEEGKYEKFLFSDALWHKSMGESEVVTEGVKDTPVVDDFITLEPTNDVSSMSFDTEIKLEPDIEPVSDIKVEKEEINNPEKDYQKIEEQAIDFAGVRKDLEEQLKSLDDLKNSLDFNTDNFSDEISFSDLEPESYGMGRVA